MQKPEWTTEEHLTGTSIMACVFDGGVVVGADSRTTTGSYIANRVSDKLTPIHDRIFVCRSGSAADTQAVADNVKYHLGVHAIELGELPKVKSAARVFRRIIYNNKDKLSASIIVAGWDPVDGPSVYTIPIGGSFVKQPFAIGGSGSTYIYGWVDSAYKEGMSREEALKFVREGLALAMARDGSSGGVIRTAVITKEGVEREMVPGNALPRFYEG
eukprot:TRINITY_DN18_c0_g1_i1.p2 TRINITY_DN18_c0_g1~~TRINITY_DN18_c0_g1_i1.p2  ORF type:complete len:215 (+),score=72.59 TRINITY_DN18_c0_g1_i1:92-736(+)